MQSDASPLSPSIKVIDTLLAVTSGDDPRLPAIIERPAVANATNVAKITFADGTGLAKKLETYAHQGVTFNVIEIVGHSNPYSCGPIDKIALTENANRLANALKSASTSNGLIRLTGCNTGVKADSDNICSIMANLLSRPIRGTKGYASVGSVQDSTIDVSCQDIWGFGQSYRYENSCCQTCSNEEGYRSLPFEMPHEYSSKVRPGHEIEIATLNLEQKNLVAALITAALQQPPHAMVDTTVLPDAILNVTQKNGPLLGQLPIGTFRIYCNGTVIEWVQKGIYYALPLQETDTNLFDFQVGAFKKIREIWTPVRI